MTRIFCAFFLSAVGSLPVQAQSIVNLESSNSRFGYVSGSYIQSSVAYEGGDAAIDIDRSILAAGFEKRLNKDLAIFFGAGAILASDVSFLGRAGSGYLLNGGASFDILRQQQLQVDGILNLTHGIESSKFKVNGEQVSVDVKTNELSLGAQANLFLSKKFIPFFTAAFLPYTDTQMTTTTQHSSGRDNLEREDRLVSSVGVSIRTKSLSLRPAVFILGEKGFQLVASYKL